MLKFNGVEVSHELIIVVVIAILSLPVLIRYLFRYLELRRRLHKLKIRTTVVTSYDVPINLPPAFFGTMLDNRLTIKEIAATILMLHLKNVLQIEYDKSTSSFQLRLLANQNQNLFRHEQYVIDVLTPHLFNGVIAAHRVGETFARAQGTFIFVVEQDLQIAGYYNFNPNITKLTPVAFGQATIGRAIFKGLMKPWNWPGFILTLFEPLYGVFWIIIAIFYYNRLGIYNYKTKSWEQIWPDIEGYYNYLFEVEKQPRGYDLTQNPELFKISKHDPYLVAAQIENNWMKIFGFGVELGSGSNKDYKTG